MKAAIPCVIMWIVAIWGETYFSQISTWFKPNLFFLMPLLFCLHWKGIETLFIFTVFGITADSFSSLPFGTFGLSFLVISFLIRWYAIKIFQDYLITVPVISGFFTLLCSVLVLFFDSFLFEEKAITFQWFQNVVLFEVIPTALISIIFYQVVIFMDFKFYIKLAERKF